MRNGRQKCLRGFSLIELMVVLSIITLVVTLSIPTYIGIKIKAGRIELSNSFNMISTLAKSYHAENGVYPEVSMYGIRPSGMGADGDYCNTDGSIRVSMKTSMGFSVTECEKMRYLYEFYPATVATHPQAISGGYPSGEYEKYTRLYFTVIGMYQHMIAADAYGNFERKWGNPPVSSRFCGSYAPGRYKYIVEDKWVYTENGETVNYYGGAERTDALYMCTHN